MLLFGRYTVVGLLSCAMLVFLLGGVLAGAVGECLGRRGSCVGWGLGVTCVWGVGRVWVAFPSGAAGSSTAPPRGHRRLKDEHRKRVMIITRGTRGDTAPVKTLPHLLVSRVTRLTGGEPIHNFAVLTYLPLDVTVFFFPICCA